MKKKLFLLFVSIFLICVEGFTMSKKPKNDATEENTTKEDVVIGKLAYVGNEPFVDLVIKAEDGKVYRIFCGEEVLKELINNFGRKMRFHGKLTSVRRDANIFREFDGEFAIESFEVIDK